MKQGQITFVKKHNSLTFLTKYISDMQSDTAKVNLFHERDGPAKKNIYSVPWARDVSDLFVGKIA